MKMKIEPGFAWIPPEEMKARINTIPLPKNVKSSFTKVVLTWQIHSGTEWTVSRLKSFKDCLLQSYATDERRCAHKPEWFRTTRSGNLAGVFGSLWRLAMQGHSNLKAVLFLVNIYTGVVRTEVTCTILDEISSSVEERDTVKIVKRSHSPTVISRGKVHRAVSSLGLVASQKVLEFPTPLNMVLPGKEGHVGHLINDISMLCNLPLQTERCARLLQRAVGTGNFAVGGNVSYLALVGRIHMTHEPGLKTRYFAAPNLVVQRALEPLQRKLLTLLAELPWDCTHDQRKADKAIATALQHERLVYSLDLSKATDAFPWDMQRLCLRAIAGNSEFRAAVDLMELAVSQCGWDLEEKDSWIMFKTGQPLGLGPSFPTFALAHGVLLYILNGYKWNEAFYVLGDDVVIFHDELARRYREVLKSWNVDISETKSFTSRNIAQFAGVTYTADGSFWVPKWRGFNSTNILDLAAWWYPGLTKGLPDHALIEWVLSLPQPYGKGRNPQGLPLDSRLTMEIIVELLESEQKAAERVKPCSTVVDVGRLIDEGRKARVSENYLLEMTLKLVGENQLTRDFLRRSRRHPPTGGPVMQHLSRLAHGTEIAGYPVMRHRKVSKSRVDPYTLGSLKTWKQRIRRVEERKRSS